MEYIDKNRQPLVSSFNAMIDGFIANGKVHYKELDDGERNQIKEALSAEQHSHCAFCMQRPQQGGTVEHVIPQSITQQNFPAALRKGKFRNDFVHQRGFNATFQPRMYPHTLAYGNVVMSCSNCNGKKSNDLLFPSFFDNPTNIGYKKDGEAVFPATSLNTNMKAHLNGYTFVKYRALWYALKQAGFSVADVCACSRKTARLAMLTSAEPFMEGYLKNKYQQNKKDFLFDYSWKMMLSFDWFWGVY